MQFLLKNNSCFFFNYVYVRKVHVVSADTWSPEEGLNSLQLEWEAVDVGGKNLSPLWQQQVLLTLHSSPNNVFKGPFLLTLPMSSVPYLHQTGCFWPSAGRAGPQMLGEDSSSRALDPCCPHQTLSHHREGVLGKRRQWVLGLEG